MTLDQLTKGNQLRDVESSTANFMNILSNLDGHKCKLVVVSDNGDRDIIQVVNLHPELKSYLLKSCARLVRNIGEEFNQL